MALTDKNIVITPNIGQTADPKIVFSGADTSTAAQNITLQVYPTNNGTLSFEGSQGQLFSINNNFTGTIFSVNDISGIPSIEVLDTGEIKMAQYSGYVRVLSSVAATTVTSGALQVTGGVGINGDLYARNIYTNGQLVGAVATGSNNLLGGTAGSIPYQESAGTTKFISIGTSGWVLKSNGSTATWSDPISLTVAVSTTATHLAVGPAGAMPIQVAPGSTSWIPAGTAGQMLVYGTNTATWTNTATIAVGRSTTATYTVNVLGGSAGQLHYQSAAGTTAFITLGTAGDVLVSGGTSSPLYQNTLTLTGVTQATSTSTGALQVRGGVGVGGNLWVGGVLYATVQGNINTATNLANGAAGSIPYQSAAGQTNFIGIGANGTLLYSNGLTATWVTTASLVVGTALSAAGTNNISGGSAGAIPYQISSGLTNFIGIGAAGNLLQSNGSTATWISTSTLLVGNAVNAGLATNVAGGTTGALHYQTAAGTTNFIGIGPTGYILQSNGTTATWQSSGALVTSSTQNINGGTAGSIVYQAAAGTTNFISIGGNGTLLRSNGTSATWVTTSTVSVAGADVAFTATRAANIAGTVTGGGMLHYQAAENSTAFLATGTAGTVLVSRAGTPIWQNTLTLAGTTAATNTLTGALVVAGGVGIGGNLYIGGVLYATVQGSINTATNISGGVAGDLLYQSAAGATSKLAIGTVGRVLTSTGSAPQWVTTGSLYVQNAQLAISANNLSGGAAGSLVYQSAAGTSAYLGIGANGTILQSNGSTAAWVSTGSLVAGIAAQSVNISGGAANQVPYQSAPSTTVFSANLTFNGTALTVGGAATAAAFIPSNSSVPSNGLYLPAANTVGLAAASTNKVNITTTGVGIAKTPATALDVSGQIRSDNIINTTNTTNATNASTGALQSAGGLGVANDAWIGNQSYASNHMNLNARVDTSERYPTGHFSSGEEVWSIDPTWTQTQLQALFNSSAYTWAADSTAPGGYCIQIDGAPNVGGEYNTGTPYIPIDTSDIFYMECWIRNDATYTGAGHYMGSIDYNESLVSLGGNPGSYGYWVMSNSSPGATWTKFSGYITGFSAGTTGTFRTGSKYWTPQALFNYSYTGGTRRCFISGWKVYKVYQTGNRYWQGIQYMQNGTAATGASTGALQVAGGASVNGNFYGGNVIAGSTQIATGRMSVFAGGAAGVGWGTGLNIGDASNYTSILQDGGYYRTRNNSTGQYLWYNAAATAATFTLDNAGNAYFTGNVYSSYSDENLKTILGKIENPLAKVKAIDTFYFEPNETALKLGFPSGRQVGVSAQSVEKVYPEAVSKAPINNEYLTVQYERLVPLLLESVKVLESKINEQEEQIKLLEEKLNGTIPR